MADSLYVKLRTQAAADATLANLLGPGDVQNFRWWKDQLRQGSKFPAVVALVMAGPGMYCAGGRLATRYSRVQLSIWDSDPDRIEDVAAAVADFLATFNAIGIDGAVAYPNYIVGDRAGLFPQTEPKKYTRIIDVMVFADESV